MLASISFFRSRRPMSSIAGQQVPIELFGPDSYFSLAFSAVNERGERHGGLGSAGTFGWGGYFNTTYFADPKEGIIGILMKQTEGASDDTGAKFGQLVFQTIDD